MHDTNKNAHENLSIFRDVAHEITLKLSPRDEDLFEAAFLGAALVFLTDAEFEACMRIALKSRRIKPEKFSLSKCRNIKKFQSENDLTGRIILDIEAHRTDNS